MPRVTRRSSPKDEPSSVARDLDYDTHTEIVISPEDDIELRRVHITNRARARRTIEVTSYAEVVLALPAADALHAAFSNLFVQTEVVPERHAILCTRRPRSLGEPAPCMLHLMAVHGTPIEEISYETDRARLHRPRPHRERPSVDGCVGTTVRHCRSGAGPIVAVRCRITLDADQEVVIDMVTGIGATRDAAISLAAKYQDRHLADRVFELAWTHSQVVLRQINANEADAQVYGRLAGSVVYATPACARIRLCSARIAAGNRACGAMPFPAISRSFCCRLATSPTLIWCGKWCRPTPTGA